MPVDNKHISYVEALPDWVLMNDVCAGERTIKAKGESYLAKLGGQSKEQYNSYKSRASFYNATQRTVDGLTGLLFRKPPRVEAPEALKNILDDVTASGLTLTGLAEQVCDCIIKNGRVGLFVDFPQVDQDQEITLEQADAAGLRPYIAKYDARSVINWRTERVNNKTVLTLVVLEETYTEFDDFEEKSKTQWRVLRLSDGVYTQEIWRDSENGKELYIQPFTPLMNKKVMGFIPFLFVNTQDTSEAIYNPPLLDLANINLSHYRTSADIEHGAHWTALPQPVITGAEQPAEKLAIGGGNLWFFGEPDAQPHMLEFQGQGLGALETRLEKKENQMAALGARMLAPEKSGVEAAETLKNKRIGETSVLASIATAASDGITKAVQLLADWAGIGGDISITINRDYYPVGMSSQELVSLVQTWQAGAIGFTDLLDNLKRGEIVHEERTADDIREENESEIPPATSVVEDDDDE